MQMARIGIMARTATAIAIGLIAICGGCTSLRLPAIDPTGQRIFLPPGNSTTLAPHRHLQLPGKPTPAFVAPPTPPPCPYPTEAPSPLAGVQAQACAKNKAKHPECSLHDCLHPARRGQVVMMPKKVIAPVGGEVVLMSGLSSVKGKPVKGQQLEWVLSQESVGHLVQVGKPKHNLLHQFASSPAELMSANYARSQTSFKKTLLTRGTESLADDVTLEPGQGWVTVTSATEGVSHVTVMASNAEIWDQRRQTATIYWVDARWEIPPPVALRAGQTHILRTRVSRNSVGVPAQNWIVRYELADGGSASFLPSGGRVAEAIVDSSGVASVEIQAGSGGDESAHVRVQVIRPVDAGEGLPQMVIGQGWTSVTWSAPGLVLRATGPAVSQPGETLTYQVQVTNPGSLATRGVVVTDEPPAGLVMLGSNPPGQQFGNRSQWPLGDLGPGEARVINIQCRLDLDRTVRYGFRAESVDGLTAQDFVETSVARPALTVEMTGPQRVLVGDKATYEVHVRNTSGRDLTEVIVTDTYDPGLEQTEGAASPIRRKLGPVRADEVKSFAISFFVRQPGNWCHTLDATAPDGYTARSQACLQADLPREQPQPGLTVELTGPPQQQTGQMALFTAKVTNTGNVPLTQVRIAMSHDPALRARQVSQDYVVDQGQFVWGVERLLPQESQLRQLHCLCLTPAQAAAVRVAVSSAENASDSTETLIQILETPPAQPGPPPAIRPPAMQPPIGQPPAGQPPSGQRPVDQPPINAIPGPAAGELSLSIADSEDPIQVGGQASYLIVVGNERDVPDSNVVVTIRLPEGLELVRAQGPVGVRASGDQGRTIEMTPINTLRAREKLRPFRIEVRGTAPGEFTLQVQARSQRSPTGVTQQETTTVVPLQP